MDLTIRADRSRVEGAAYVAAAVLGAVSLAWLLSEGQGRLALAVSVCVVLIGLSVRHPRAAVVSTLLYLGFLGEIRRLLMPLFGWSGSDPLLLVGPAVVGALAMSLLIQKRLVPDTRLAKWIALLMGVMGLQVLNPLQGGLGVGIAGMLFYIVPLLWYWAGRTFGDERFAGRILLLVVLPVAVTSAVYGLIQFFIGLPPHQQMWMDTAAPAALYTSAEAIKPFALFTSAQELALLCSVGIAVCYAYALAGHRWVLLALTPLFLTTLFVIASRGPLVGVTVMLGLGWAFMGKSRAAMGARLVPALAVAVLGLIFSLQQIQQVEFEGTLAHAADHQTTGLLNPMDEEHSTASVHLSMIGNGFLSALTNPIGYGLGATTLAAGKFGGEGKSSETDFGDLFYSLGLLGVIYLGVIGLVFALAFRRWRRTRSPATLAVLLLLVLTFGVWLKGGMYFMIPVVWLLVGALDRSERSEAAVAAVREPTETPGPLQRPGVGPDAHVRRRAARTA